MKINQTLVVTRNVRVTYVQWDEYNQGQCMTTNHDQCPECDQHDDEGNWYGGSQTIVQPVI